MAPRSSEQFQTIREESTRRIVEAALTLFAEHGYAGTTIRMIAKEAGISLGLMYNYFSGKEELLRAIFQQGRADIGASFASAGEGEAALRIGRLLAASVEIAVANRRFWLLFHALRMQPSVLAGLAPELAGWTQQVVAHLRGMVEQAGSEEPETDARLLFAMVDGIVQHALLDPGGYPGAEVAARAAALMQGGLTSGAGAGATSSSTRQSRKS
jgi:AcrR family transcriptional regulator